MNDRIAQYRGTDTTVALPQWAWAAVLVVGVVAYNVVLSVTVNTNNPNFFPSLLMIGAVTVPLAVLVYTSSAIEGLQINPWLVVFTALGGGLIGTVAAGVLEYRTLVNLGALPMLFVGLIEESAKLIVPLIIYFTIRGIDSRAGVVLGVASGMGFASLETMGYGFQALLQYKSLAAVDATLQLRGLLSPACHIAWTGMCVAMLWRIPGARDKGLARRRFVLTFLAAVLLHAAWDASQSLLVHVIIAVAGLVALLTLIRQAGRQR